MALFSVTGLLTAQDAAASTIPRVISERRQVTRAAFRGGSPTASADDGSPILAPRASRPTGPTLLPDDSLDHEQDSVQSQVRPSGRVDPNWQQGFGVGLEELTSSLDRRGEIDATA